MFDNFGFGEFMTIAIFALLFFGPERLPQMGARLGRWLAQLTQQSKVFMYQWREEALAIHGAVEEVRGIRDEIMAARRELAGTMTSAQSDIAESIDDVKGTLGGSKVTLDKMVQQAEATERARQTVTKAKTTTEVEAIAKSQAILADMETRLGDDEAEPAAPEAVEDVVEEKKAPKLTAQERSEQILTDMQHKMAGEPAVENAAIDAPEIEAEERSIQPTPGTRILWEKDATRKGPTATERTQDILEKMQRKLAVEEPQREVVEPAAPQETGDEWSKNHDLIMAGLGQGAQSTADAPRQVKKDVTTQTRPIEPTAAPTNGAHPEIKALNEQVATLQDELASLHKALEALRAEMLVKTALSSRPPGQANAAEERA